MGGKDPTLVLYRKLTESDVDPSLGHVVLNNELLKDLIPKMKKTDVSVLLDSKSNGLAVEAVDKEFRMYYVVIKRRDMDQFELDEEWKVIVELNKLKEGDSICIWAFLCGDDGDLCLSAAVWKELQTKMDTLPEA
ncbi:B3 domain-containing protein At1g05930-like [Magnolia sinica]|uniref:B3 domain-containing protein At1g05930-like n=1 Tax=Magnolia sinica TaxID=86752 RepID=UPI00265B440A|nr:B3 domain-containing protein At1g05930-like [Magnolia sinica]